MEKNVRIKKGLVKISIVLLILLLILAAGHRFVQSHFLWGTVIDDVSCSFLSIDEAIEKVNLEKGKETITFVFINGETYDVDSKQLGIRGDEAQVVRIFDQQHSNPKETRKYSLDGFILYDEEMLREFFEQIPELQEENLGLPR